MRSEPPRDRRWTPVSAFAAATLVVVGGWALYSLGLTATLPPREQTPIQAQVPAAPEHGWYDEGTHGDTIAYWGRTYEPVGVPVRLDLHDVQPAGDSEEEVVVYFRASEAEQRVGGGGGGGGRDDRRPYPDDKGPLYVKVGPDQFRLLRQVP